MFRIALVMPVYGNAQLTKKSLENIRVCNDKLRDSTGNALSVVVVDDASPDNTKEVLSEFSWVYTLTGDGKLWWSGGINKGVAFAKDELKVQGVLLWNNDILADEDYFVKLVDIVMQRSDHEEKHLIGSCIYDLMDGSLWSAGGVFDFYTGSRYMLKDIDALNTGVQVNWLPGMGTYVPIEVVNTIGFLNEADFPQYHGDSDFTLRASKAGFLISVSKELVIRNDTRNSSYEGSDLRTYLNSLKGSNIKSRYNISKEVLFFKAHARSPLWIFLLIRKNMIYFSRTFLNISFSKK